MTESSSEHCSKESSVSNVHDELHQNSDFAVICSFFNKFGALLGLKPHTFTKLEQILSFDEKGKVDKESLDLHVRLLRRVGLTGASALKFEHHILRFCSLCPVLTKEQKVIQRFGYVHSSLATKLRVLKVLCEKQFDYNPKFKEHILSQFTSAELRLLPVGIDKDGQAYWYQQDSDVNLRIYSEEPDDQSGGTWMLKAGSRNELYELLESLKGNPVKTAPGVTSIKTEDADVKPDLNSTKGHLEQETKKPGESGVNKPLKKDLSAQEEAESSDTKPGAKPTDKSTDSKTIVDQSAKPDVSKRETRDVDEPAATDSTGAKNAEAAKTAKGIGKTAAAEADQSSKPDGKSEAPDAGKPSKTDTTNATDTQANGAERTSADTNDVTAKEPNADADTSVDGDDSAPVEDVVETKPAMVITNKKGTFMDTFQGEVKQVSSLKKGSKKTCVDRLKDADDGGSTTPQDEKSDDSQHGIPEALKPFIERRVLPRRNASLQASERLQSKDSARKKTTAPATTTTAVTDDTKKKPPAGAAKSNGTGKGATSAASGNKGGLLEEEADDDEESSEDEQEGRRKPRNDRDKSDDDFDDELSAAASTDDDEFMPLSELRRLRAGATPKRRRRAGKRKKHGSESGSSNDDTEVTTKRERKKATNETLCQHCHKSSNPDVLLLCDSCDDAWHTWCLRPALWYVPDDDWFCPRCQHAMLCDKLQQALAQLDDALAKKTVQDKKKSQAANRWKREMEFIGISMNNIIPATDSAEAELNGEEEEDESGEESGKAEDSEDSEGRRRSKRQTKNNKKQRRQHDSRPVVPLALARSKRQRKQVDYNFQDYDELILDAMDEMEEAPKLDYREVRPSGGYGRGKDMANIMKQEARRTSSKDTEDELEKNGGAGVAGGDAVKKNEHAAENGETTAAKRSVAKPPATPAVFKAKKPRLTDLDIDNATDSDTDEYQEPNDSEYSEEEAEPSTDEWLPEEASERPRRRSTRNQRTRSDEEFVNDDSDEDYTPSKAKSRRASRNDRKRKRRGGGDSSSDESAESIAERSKKRGRASSGGSDEENSDPEYRPGKKKSETGRPLRKVRAKEPIDYKALEGGSSSETEKEEAEQKKKKNVRPVGALSRGGQGATIADSDDDSDTKDEFKPDADEESEDDGEEEAEEKDEEQSSSSDSESAAPTMAPAVTNTRRRNAVADDDDDSEDEQEQDAEADDGGADSKSKKTAAKSKRNASTKPEGEPPKQNCKPSTKLRSPPTRSKETKLRRRINSDSEEEEETGETKEIKRTTRLSGGIQPPADTTSSSSSNDQQLPSCSTAAKPPPLHQPSTETVAPIYESVIRPTPPPLAVGAQPALFTPYRDSPPAAVSTSAMSSAANTASYESLQSMAPSQQQQPIFMTAPPPQHYYAPPPHIVMTGGGVVVPASSQQQQVQYAPGMMPGYVPMQQQPHGMMPAHHQMQAAVVSSQQSHYATMQTLQPLMPTEGMPQQGEESLSGVLASAMQEQYD